MSPAARRVNYLARHDKSAFGNVPFQQSHVSFGQAGVYCRLMKNITPKILLFVLPALSFVHASIMPAMEVTVTNAAGKVAYKGTTSANGTFATGNLEPGNYVVEFDSKAKIAKGTNFLLSATAGKNTVGSDSVPGERFVNPGMAMRISVSGNTKITGSVAPAGSVPKQTQTAANGKAKKWDGPTKIVNGKKYIWIHPQTSTLSGGHWVEEGSPEAIQAQTNMVEGSQPAPRNSSMKY
jgi:hypothetical protein